MTMDPMTLGDGRYRLGGVLGRGGMAEVRQADDLRLGRTVAIKRLRTDLASDPTFQARFRREAQSAASLNHPAIVAVYDTGEELATDGSGLMVPYIVMEYVEGRTLRDILREGRRILPERALEITGAVLDALDYSHRAGIIHRDIKPANVMLTPAGDVKVMDFGIARAIADSSATMTQTAAVVGTAQYLSPEQARGEQVDARSDLYSAGCLLFELLTGRPPFVGDSPVSVAYQHVREEAAPPSSVDPEVSPEIDAITLKALTKRVDERYQSAAEMRADIDRALDGRPVLAPSYANNLTADTQAFLPPPPRDPDPTAVTSAYQPADEPPEKRRTWLWVLLIALLLLAIGAAAFAVPRLLGDEPAPTVEVPKIIGETPAKAEQLLAAQNLTLNQCDTVNGKQKNRIVRQDPAPGDQAEEGSAVDCTVSIGPKTQIVPDVTDLNLSQATEALEERKFVVDPVADSESTEKKNQVTRTDPSASTELPQGSTVTVYYSTGWILVESYVGEQYDDAAASLTDAGFQPVRSNVPSDQPEGQVVSQNFENVKKPFGTTIVLEVSLGPTETTTTEPTTPTTPTETTSTTTTTTTQQKGGPPAGSPGGPPAREDEPPPLPGPTSAPR